MEEQKSKKSQHIREEGDIDIMDYVALLWKKRMMIFKWSCIGAIIGLVIGFSLPKIYKAGATLAPEAAGESSSGIGGIAAMMGVNLENNADAISLEMFPDVAHSTPFIVGLFDLPVQFERKDSVINTTLFDYVANYQRKPWWSPIINAPIKVLKWCISLVKKEKKELSLGNDARKLATLTKKERKVVKYFAENIIVNIDKKTGKTQIEMEMQDPLVVYITTQAVVDHLTEYMSNYRTSKVRQDIDNLKTIYSERKTDYYKAQQAYAKYVDANKNVILQSAQAEQERLLQEMELAYQIYSQVATQLETSRIKEQEIKPVFTILEPVAVPNQKSGPSKAKLLILFTFLAGCCAAGWALFEDDILEMIKDLTKD